METFLHMAAFNQTLRRIRSRLGQFISPLENKKSPFLWPAYQNGVVTWGMGNFLAYVNEGFNLNALIYAAIMYKVRAAAQVRLRAYDGDPDSPEPLPSNHPLSKLLARPNPYQSFAELHGLIIAYLNLAGNAYLYVDREGAKNGVPAALYPLRPDRVWIIPGEGTIKGYLYRPPTYGMADGVPILPEDMIHIKFPNLGDEYEGMGYGLSPMSSLAQSADVDNNLTKFIKLFFERGGMPVGILKYNIPLELPQIHEIKQKWREIYGGIGNWTDVGVVDAGSITGTVITSASSDLSNPTTVGTFTAVTTANDPNVQSLAIECGKCQKYIGYIGTIVTGGALVAVSAVGVKKYV